MARILIYSHDTYGLGNIRRMATIAEALVKGDSSANVLIITGSPMLHAFRLHPRIDYVKLPCLNRTDVGRYEVKHLAISQDSARRMRASIIAAAAIDFDPDILLTDKKPLGVMRELEPTLQILSRRARPPRTYLILRDILDAPEKTREVWARNDYHAQVANYYDEILVVGERNIFDLAVEYAFPLESARKLSYAGYLKRSAGRTGPGEVRASIGVNDERLVLVQTGGGADGAATIDAYLDALEIFGTKAPCKSWINCGPELNPIDRLRLRTRMAEFPDVIPQDFTEDMNSCINAADAVVSMGGYNSVCEILSLQKPALIIPRTQPVEEQWVRAERFARRGMVDCLHPDDMSGASIHLRLNKLLAYGRSQLVARRSLSLKGLEFLQQRILQGGSTSATDEFPAFAIGA
jgi:predicted glycosyltransferase